MQPYTRIENSLLNALCKVPITGQELRVLLFIIRYTKGFNRDTAELSVNFIASGTDLNRRSVQRTLSKLADAGYIILSNTHGTKPRKITFRGGLDVTPRGGLAVASRGGLAVAQEIKEIKKTDQPATADAERLAVIKKALAEEWVPDEL